MTNPQNVNKDNETTGIILMYHRIADVACDPWGLCVSPARFERHLAFLKRSEYELSSLEDIQKNKDHLRIAITFDDGYSDNYLKARPLLERYEVPATFFIVSGSVGSDEEFWWDHLERVIINGEGFLDRLRLEIQGEAMEWERPGNGKASREQAYRKIWEALSVLSLQEKRSAIKQLESQIRATVPVRKDYLPMNRDQVGRLAGSGLFTIGSHTISHPFLDRLSKEEQQREIGKSKTDLEEMTGRPVDIFSCPHGRYNDETADILKNNGYCLACVSGDRNVSAGSSPFALMRRVVENWGEHELEAKIQGWIEK